MEQTISGVYSSNKKTARRQRALQRLERRRDFINTKIANEKGRISKLNKAGIAKPVIEESEKYVSRLKNSLIRINSEITTLKTRI